MELLLTDSMGWTPIMIKTIINEALIHAHQEGREFLTYKDWLDAADEHVMGRGEGASLAAPTNLTASDDAYNNKVGLYWDTIKGATLYRVFRNAVNSPGTATDVGTTASNSFFDVSAPAAQIFLYRRRGLKGLVIRSGKRWRVAFRWLRLRPEPRRAHSYAIELMA